MIKDLLENPDGPVNEIFMVKQQTKATSNNGSPYLSLTLQDASGTLEAKMWSIEDSDVTLSNAGSLIRVYGQMSVYKGHPQLKINSLDAVELSPEELAKYIPVAPVALDQLKKELADDIASIQDSQLKTLVETLIKANYEAYTTYPAAVTVHHAYLGGLLYHSLSICSMAKLVQAHYPTLSYDYLVAGSLLHDIGKTKELNGPRAVSYTEAGNLLGHITLGAMMVYEEGKKEGVDSERLDVLTHMILAHHGEPEYGSPKVPATAEAYVLHALDDLDAKMECLRGVYDTTEEGAFTAKIAWMENTAFYKPHKLK
ncbi:MAG: HD domain-containing protein [Bacilli bacterium]|jgi:3'-5' exoribonuclease|nr:HD domain-containing protein [Bacilli bacterium]